MARRSEWPLALALASLSSRLDYPELKIVASALSANQVGERPTEYSRECCVIAAEDFAQTLAVSLLAGRGGTSRGMVRTHDCHSRAACPLLYNNLVHEINAAHRRIRNHNETLCRDIREVVLGEVIMEVVEMLALKTDS